MKKLYLIVTLFLLIGALPAMAQRNVDLELVGHYVGTSASNRPPLSNSTSFTSNVNNPTNLYLAYEIKNNGPDTLAVGDTLKIRGHIGDRMFNLVYVFPPSWGPGVPAGLGKDSSIAIVPMPGSGGIFVNDGAGNGVLPLTENTFWDPAATVPYNGQINWCDSVWAVRGIMNTFLSLTTTPNDERCNMVTFNLTGSGGPGPGTKEVDLRVSDHFTGPTPAGVVAINNNTRLLANADGSTKLFVKWHVSNNGPDALVAGDTIKLHTSIGASVFDITHVLTSSLSSGNTETIVSLPSVAPQSTFANDGSGNGYFSFTPNKLFTTPATGSYPLQWCDIVSAAKGPANPAFTLTNTGNDVNCHNITVDVWMTGINALNNEEDGFLLFPNPASGVLNVKYDFGNTTNATIAIRDIMGKVVSSTELKNVSGTQQHTIDISKLSPGIYTAELNAEGKKIVSKISVR